MAKPGRGRADGYGDASPSGVESNNPDAGAERPEPPLPTPPTTADLLLALVRRWASGVLEVQHGGFLTQIFLLGGRIVHVETADPRGGLAALLVEGGVIPQGTAEGMGFEELDDDAILEQAAAVRHEPRDRLEGFRREVLRRRVRLALAEGEGGRFIESGVGLAGIDPALLPDLDPHALCLGLRAPAPAPVVAEKPAPDVHAAWSLVDRVQKERHEATWFDLLGVRPGASTITLKRAAAELLATLQPLLDSPGLRPEQRHKVGAVAAAIERARDNLVDDAGCDAYMELLRRGGAPRVAELLGERSGDPRDPPAPTSLLRRRS